MKIKKNRSGCPIATSLDIVGDKWSLVVIRDLFLGRQTFSKIMLASPEKIASNILADRLKKLRSRGIIDFRVGTNDKKVKEYFLTDVGIDLYPLIYELMQWSLKHFEFELHPLTKDWLLSNKGLSDEEIISSAMVNYKNSREAI